MGMDVCRYIEIYTEDNSGFVHNIDELDKIGKFTVGDVVLVYNGKNNYWRIINIDSDNNIEYEPIVMSSDDIEESMQLMKSLNIVHRCEFESKLPKKQISLKDGDIYKYWGNTGPKYMQYQNGAWVEIKSCPKTWKQIIWNNDNTISSGCSCFIKDYIYNYDSELARRGLPENVSESIKNSIKEYEFGITYATLAEIEHCSINVRNNFKNYIIKSFSNCKFGQIDKKLNHIIENINKRITYREPFKEYDDCEFDTFEEDFYDSICDVEMAQDEYTKIDTIVDAIYDNYISNENIRVIYAFNN